MTSRFKAWSGWFSREIVLKVSGGSADNDVNFHDFGI